MVGTTSHVVTGRETPAQERARIEADPQYLARLAEGQARAEEERDARLAADEAAPFRVDEVVEQVRFNPVRGVPATRWRVTATWRDGSGGWRVTGVRVPESPWEAPRDFFPHELTAALTPQ